MPNIYSLFRRFAKFFSRHRLRERFPFINSVYTTINRSLAPKKAEVFGHVMILDRDDSMSLSVAGIYEPTETQIITKIIRIGDTVLDIGANIGYYTLIFAKLVGATGKVYAFEPDPESFSILMRNIQTNSYENVSAHQKAVSDQAAELTLYRDRFNNLDHRIIQSSEFREGVKVSAVKLDNFMEADIQVDFIKMDIQGAEGLALHGMKNILERNKSIKIITEFWPEGLSMSGIQSDIFLYELRDMGFKLFDLTGDKLGRTEVTPEWLNERYAPNPTEHTNILCIKEQLAQS